MSSVIVSDMSPIKKKKKTENEQQHCPFQRKKLKPERRGGLLRPNMIEIFFY